LLKTLIFSNLDHLGYLAMQNKTRGKSSSNNSACTGSIYKFEAVELKVGMQSCDGCFEFAAGQAAVCLPQQETIKVR
jgi:hypothetical protein